MTFPTKEQVDVRLMYEALRDVANFIVEPSVAMKTPLAGLWRNDYALFKASRSTVAKVEFLDAYQSRVFGEMMAGGVVTNVKVTLQGNPVCHACAFKYGHLGPTCINWPEPHIVMTEKDLNSVLRSRESRKYYFQFPRPFPKLKSAFRNPESVNSFPGFVDIDPHIDNYVQMSYDRDRLGKNCREARSFKKIVEENDLDGYAYGVDTNRYGPIQCDGEDFGPFWNHVHGCLAQWCHTIMDHNDLNKEPMFHHMNAEKEVKPKAQSCDAAMRAIPEAFDPRRHYSIVQPFLRIPQPLSFPIPDEILEPTEEDTDSIATAY